MPLNKQALETGFLIVFFISIIYSFDNDEEDDGVIFFIMITTTSTSPTILLARTKIMWNIINVKIIICTSSIRAFHVVY